MWQDKTTSKRAEVLNNSDEINKFTPEAQKKFEVVQKAIKNPEKAIEWYAQGKVDQITTGAIDKVAGAYEKYTPEWIKNSVKWLEENVPFFKEIKNWFGEKISGIKNWVTGAVGGVLGIDLFEHNSKNEKIKNKQKEKEEKADSFLEQAKELMQNNSVAKASNNILNFVKSTSLELDQDLENNFDSYALLKDFKSEIGSMLSWPTHVLSYFLKKWIKSEKIEEWGEILKKSGEKAFWVAVLAGLGYKFVKGGKITRWGIIGFILYGLDKKFSHWEILKGTIKGLHWIPSEWKEKSGRWMENMGAENVGEVMQNQSMFSPLFYINLMEAIEKDSLPSLLLWTGASVMIGLEVAGKWIFIEPMKGYVSGMIEAFQGKFSEAAQSVLIGQIPIMATAIGYQAIKGKSWKALGWAWDVALPRLLWTHKGRIDTEMFLRRLTKPHIWQSLEESTKLTNKIKYLAKLSAYQQNDSQALTKLLKKANFNQNLANFEFENMNGEKFKIKDYKGKEYELAKKLKEDVEYHWLDKESLKEKFIKRQESIKNNPDYFAGESKEIWKKLEENRIKYGEELDLAHKKLVDAIASWDQAKIQEATKAFKLEKTRIKGKIGADFKKYGIKHLEAFKSKPIGHFGKLTMKGASLVYVGFEGARIVKMFARGESKSAGEAAFELGLRLAPVTGTYMDVKDAWQAFKRGELKQAGISSAFAALGAVSDALWVFGGVGGAATRGVLAGARTGKIALKSATVAKALGKYKKSKNIVLEWIEQTAKFSKGKIKNVKEIVTGSKVWKYGLRVAIPSLAIFLYENLETTEEVIK